MLRLREIADWLTGLPKALPLPFTPGAEEPEYGVADLVGTVTRLSGGEQVREGTFAVNQVQILLRGRSRDFDDLETTAAQIDEALRAVSNEMIWGTYVTYVAQQGGWTDSFEPDERVSLIATYEIENGL